MYFFPIFRNQIAQTTVLALGLFVLHLASSPRNVEGHEAAGSVVSSPLTVSPTTLSFGKVPKGGEKDLTVTRRECACIAHRASTSNADSLRFRRVVDNRNSYARARVIGIDG